MEFKTTIIKNSINLELTNQGLLVAYIDLKYDCSDKNKLVLHNLYVDKKYRRKGIAEKIMKKLIENIENFQKINTFDSVVLYVEPLENSINFSKLMNFYKKFGFRKNKGSLNFMTLKLK